MKRSVFAVAVFSLSGLAMSTPTATKPAVLVELFTSEGCSSCPPADNLLAALDREKGYHGIPVVVLSEHVDYWDHEGWRDPFSSPDWTQRQNNYNLRFHLDSVYTPQMVINGTQQVNGSDGPKIAHALETATAQAQHISIEITGAAWSGDTLQATVNVPEADAKGADLYAVLADDQDTSDVKRGENAGHTLTNVAVARVLRKVGKLRGPYNGQIRISLPRGIERGKMRLIVFVQKGENGEVLGAAERDV
jgi:hypothetical protein